MGRWDRDNSYLLTDSSKLQPSTKENRKASKGRTKTYETLSQPASPQFLRRSCCPQEIFRNQVSFQDGRQGYPECSFTSRGNRLGS